MGPLDVHGSSASRARRREDRQQDAFDHLFGLIYDKTPAISRTTTARRTAAVEEYRIFSNPEMNDKAKAINDDTDGTFGAKLKMEAKQLAPTRSTLPTTA